MPENPETESDKTNKVLLYLLTKEAMRAPYFTSQYSGKIDQAKLAAYEENASYIDLGDMKEIVGEEEWHLSKLRRDFSKAEMDEDVYFALGEGGDERSDSAELLTDSYQNNPVYQGLNKKVVGTAMAERLKGRIIIKVEDEGQAYYINHATKVSHYLGRPADAFEVMRRQGIGIGNADLQKIPVGLDNLSGQDSDSDGLSDIFEDAIGTDKDKQDTDGDGHNNKVEIMDNYDPAKGGGATLSIDQNFVNKHKGKIFLQVEANGEAWYVNPADGKRYFLGRPADAFNIMRNLGLGISNQDYEVLTDN